MASVTIREVAKAAGVSLKTVSRVANGEANVSEDTRSRVAAAIRDLGYVPNLAARRMGGTRSYLLVAFNDRRNTLNNWESGRGNDWVDQMLHGALLACERLGYRLLFELIDGTADDVDVRVSGVLASLQPDGVILTPPHSDDPRMLAVLDARATPYIRMGSFGPGDGRRVFMDDRAAAIDATRHLLDLGHRSIGFIMGDPRFAVSSARRDGWRGALAAAGIDADDGLEQPGDFTFEAGARAAAALLGRQHPPTAILASNDEMALAVLSVAHARGLALPDDLSVVSFDDTPGVRFSMPPLTAVRQPIAPMAARAAEILIARAAGRDPPDAAPLLPHALVVRASTARPGRA